MISRRNALLAAIAGFVDLGGAYSAFAKKPSLVAKFDTDNDGTVDLAEAKKAASALFEKLDTDKDGTLDIKELQAALAEKNLLLPIRTTTRPLPRTNISRRSKSGSRPLIPITMAP